jgi:hypothetical protein
MSSPRTDATSFLFVQTLSDLTYGKPSKEDAIFECCDLLCANADEGQPYVYSGHPDLCYAMPCLEFLIVYQFSETEIRFLDLLLKKDA